jgi:Txe/YoeB family toxin of Txe-Axe toxin-antitoxin module
VKTLERAFSRVLLRTVESGAWRVMRKIEKLAALTTTRWIRGKG